MPTVGASSRDGVLIARAWREYDVDVTAARLDHWRRWRGVGVIPRPPKPRVRGWRPGLAETIPSEEVQRVAEVAELVDRYGDVDFAALILCARGHQVDCDAIREAVLDFAEKLGRDPSSSVSRALRVLRQGRVAARRRQSGYSRLTQILEADWTPKPGTAPDLYVFNPRENRYALDFPSFLSNAAEELGARLPTVRERLTTGSPSAAVGALRLGYHLALRSGTRERFGLGDDREAAAPFFALDCLLQLSPRFLERVPAPNALAAAEPAALARFVQTLYRWC